MLPNSKNFPSVSSKLSGQLSITPSVAFDFSVPILLISGGPPITSRASVPETAIHKNNDTLASKSEIRFSCELLGSSPALDTELPENIYEA
jgi:hypothetical protein